MLETYECKCCTAPLDIREAAGNVLCCKFCGSVFTLTKSTDPQALAFLRMGEHDLDTCKFDDASTAYKKAAELDPAEPEAHFGMALAAYKVQYLKDEVNNRLQPICHEVSEKCFSADKNYLHALELSGMEQKRAYRDKAREIDDIRDRFSSLKESGLIYDCFLCTKVTREDGGGKTEDCARANDIYYHLKEKGYRPFFSEREMKERTGSDYEALILYALYVSECMLIVCSEESYLQSKWVKNEYTRFAKMIADEEKEKDAITFVFGGAPIERLPGKSGKIQGIALNTPHAYTDIVDYVEKHTPAARAKREEEKRRRELELEQLAEFRKWRSSEEARKEEARKENEGETNPNGEERKARPAPSPFKIKDGVLLKYRGSEEEVVIPDNVSAIGDGAFRDNASLKSVVISDAVTSIGKTAFFGCLGLTSVSIPDSVTKLDDFAFSNCSRLASITLPAGITAIGKKVFAGCIKLESVHWNIVRCMRCTSTPDMGSLIRMSQQRYTGNPIFTDCAKLSTVTFGESVKEIPASAFEGCSALEEVEFPPNVSSIGYMSFFGCTGLGSLSIPNSISKIDDGAFAGCRKLRYVTMPRRLAGGLFKEKLQGIFGDEVSHISFTYRK